MLRWLAAAATVLVVARVGWEPRIVGADVGTTPIFNWILYGYGVPAISFWVAGHLLRQRADDKPSRMVDSAAILFTVLTAFLEIRHFMNGGDIYRHTSRLGELALQVCTGLAMTIGLEHIRHRTGSVVHDVGALVIARPDVLRHRPRPVADLQSAVHRRAGRRRASSISILLGYGIPAVLAIVLAMQTRDVRPPAYRIVAAGVAVLLMLSYLSLEVRTALPRAGAEQLGRPPTPSNTPTRWSGSPTAWRCCCSASRSARSRRGSRPPRSRCSPSPRCS